MRVLVRWLGRFSEDRVLTEAQGGFRLGVIRDIQINGWC